MPITLGTDCWVAAGAFIGPGVTINDEAVVGARAVVCKNVASNTVVAGNPAKLITHRNQQECLEPGNIAAKQSE
jgi:acetyltransferase-like isoleucine patch superfamily enzyme